MEICIQLMEICFQLMEVCFQLIEVCFQLMETCVQLMETSYPLSANGTLLSANGNLLSGNGSILSAYRNLLSAKGNLLSANGNLLSANGNLLSGAFSYGKLETCFQLMETCFQVLSAKGNWTLSAARPHSISLHSGSILVKSKSYPRMDSTFKHTSTLLLSNKLRYPPRKLRRRRASFLKTFSPGDLLQRYHVRDFLRVDESFATVLIELPIAKTLAFLKADWALSL